MALASLAMADGSISLEFQLCLVAPLLIWWLSRSLARRIAVFNDRPDLGWFRCILAAEVCFLFGWLLDLPLFD
jgi:hypothetical protein